MLSTDLDVMEEVLDGFRVLLEIELCGPWTLAATLELPRTLNVAIADPGGNGRPDRLAGRKGAAAHVAEITKRVPGARIVVQLDEPPSPPWREARCRRRAGCRGSPRSRPTCCRSGWPR